VAMPANTEADFWAQVQIGSEDECWPWLGLRLASGYGRFAFRRKILLAHRYVWRVTHGAIPAGKFVLHRCDNPPCCNPAHLFLGNHDVNMSDMKHKGRACHGTVHWSAKLTPGKVREIRRRLRDGDVQVVVAKRFGVTQHLVSMIKRRLVWAHVP